MASNMKEIKERMNSVNNSKQITNAMNIVSSTKFKKFQKLTLQTRSYTETVSQIFNNILTGLSGTKHVLFDGKKNIKRVGIIVMTSDRGLCGSFNSNALKRMEKLKNKFENNGCEVSVISIGRKAREYCRTHNIDVDSEFIQLIPETMYSKAKIISEDIVDFYLNDQYDEVYLIYSKFLSVISYELKEVRVMPFSLQEEDSKKLTDLKHTYSFEPNENDVLVEFIPKMLSLKLYQALLENTASEHSARMTAMKNASENAQEMINKLTLEYNRVRQSIITQELAEIVGGAEALK